MDDVPSDATIHLERSNQWLGRKVALVALVDGSPAGELHPTQDLSLSVTPGDHRVQMRYDDVISNEVEVRANEGRTIELACTTSPGWAWFNIFA
jgi:hypothetical protein